MSIKIGRAAGYNVSKRYASDRKSDLWSPVSQRPAQQSACVHHASTVLLRWLSIVMAGFLELSGCQTDGQKSEAEEKQPAILKVGCASSRDTVASGWFRSDRPSSIEVARSPDVIDASDSPAQELEKLTYADFQAHMLIMFSCGLFLAEFPIP